MTGKWRSKNLTTVDRWYHDFNGAIIYSHVIFGQLAKQGSPENAALVCINHRVTTVYHYIRVLKSVLKPFKSYILLYCLGL